jgi:hypothetical protein
MIDLRTLVDSLNGAPFPEPTRERQPKAPKPPKPVKPKQVSKYWAEILVVLTRDQPCTIQHVCEVTGYPYPMVHYNISKRAQRCGKVPRGSSVGATPDLWRVPDA